MSPARPDPLRALVDALVFAPIGALVTIREAVPKLVTTGQKQVEQRTALAKMIGQFAVTKGRQELTRRLDAYLADAASSATSPGRATEAPSAGVASTSVTDAARADTVSGAETTSPDPLTTDGMLETDLAIHGYDHLAASQIVARLEQLTEAELNMIEQYETSHRARRTVLGKIILLRGT